MKKSVTILLATLIIGVISIGCKDDDPEFQTKDFVATFFTDLVSFTEDSINCAPPRNFLNTQEGSGSESTLGNFTTSMTFCVNPNTFEYGDVEAEMIAEDGGTLFFTGSGQVVPTTKAGYDLEFKDPFTIIGGTGKFENATGSGMTESYVNMTTGRTDHVWTGTITLKN